MFEKNPQLKLLLVGCSLFIAAAFCPSNLFGMQHVKKGLFRLRWLSKSSASAMHHQPELEDPRIIFRGNDHSLYTLDSFSGKSLWVKIQTKKCRIVSSPTIQHEIVVASFEDVTKANTQKGLVAFNAVSGKFLWSNSTDYTPYNKPLICGDLVVCAGSGFLESIDGFDLHSGKKVWCCRLSPQDCITGLPVLIGKALFLPVATKHIFDFNLTYALVLTDVNTGKERERISISDSIVGKPEVIGSLLLGHTGTNLIAVDLVMKRVCWTFSFVRNELLHFVELLREKEETLRSYAVLDDCVVVCTSRGRFFGLTLKTGMKVWERKFDAYPYIAYNPAKKGRLVFLCNGKDIVAIDGKSGKTLESFRAKGQISCSPLYVDNTLYFGCEKGYIYALDVRNP